MKTPLPEKLRKEKIYGGDYAKLSETMVTVDQIITYLAELTEVVEGKHNPNGCSFQNATTPSLAGTTSVPNLSIESTYVGGKRFKTEGLAVGGKNIFFIDGFNSHAEAQAALELLLNL